MTGDTAPTRAALRCPSCGRCFIVLAQEEHAGANPGQQSKPKVKGAPVSTITPRLFSLREAATYLGRDGPAGQSGVRSIEWLVAKKAFPVVRSAGTSRVFVDRRDLDEWIERGKDSPGKPAQKADYP